MLIPYWLFVTFVVIFMGFILYNLFRALYFLVTRKEGGHGTARHLGRRIGLSMLFFILLVILRGFGLVEDKNFDSAMQELKAENKITDKEDEGKTIEEIQLDNNPSGGRIRLKQ